MSQRARTAILVALATFALALILRLYGLGRDPWLDEVYSQFAISRGWLDLADDRISRGHSPFYFALMKATGIPVTDIAALRIPSVVFDSLGAAVVAAAVAVYVNLRAAVLFGLLYALSPLAIYWSQNARPYGLLMLSIGIALAGTMGMFATLGRETAEDATEWRWPRRLFGVGFSLASLTITAGIMAFLATAALPFALPGIRADRDFLSRWRRSLTVPGVVAALSYLAFSRQHVVQHLDGYWAEKYNTFGIEGLTNLWATILTSDVHPAAPVAAGLGNAGDVALTWAVTLVLAAAIWLGARAARPQPTLLAPALLGLGYAGLLVALSAWVSLLVPRYFLPAVMALLVLAAAGLAGLLQRRLTLALALIVPLVALEAVAAVSVAARPGASRDPGMQRVADIIDRVSPDTVRIIFDAQDSTRASLFVETYTRRLERPELGRPSTKPYDFEQLTTSLAEYPDVFAYIRNETWAAARSAGAPAPTCTQDFGDWVLLYWGRVAAACTH